MNKKNALWIAGAVVGVIAISSAAIALNLSGWRYHSKISFEIRLDNKVIAACAKASVSDLFPKPNGGYRLDCQQSSTDTRSVYIMYETDADSPFQGEIDRITIDHTQQFYPTQDTSAAAACASGQEPDRSTGGKPLPTTPVLHDIGKGTFNMPLALPCGSLILEIGKSKQTSGQS